MALILTDNRVWVVYGGSKGSWWTRGRWFLCPGPHPNTDGKAFRWNVISNVERSGEAVLDIINNVEVTGEAVLDVISNVERTC